MLRGGMGADAFPSKVVIYSDGAARGNPGPAGAGAVVVDEQGRTLVELRRALGSTTNNVAEYEAAILGLQEARARGAKEVELRADSELMVKQLQGAYKVKAAHLRPLYDQARGLLDEFDRARISHVRRERNRTADRLANEAIDGKSPGPVEDDDYEDLLKRVLDLPESTRRDLLSRLRDSL